MKQKVWQQLNVKLRFAILMAAFLGAVVVIRLLVVYYKLDDAFVSYLKLCISESPVETFAIGFLVAGLIGYACGRHDAS